MEGVVGDRQVPFDLLLWSTERYVLQQHVSFYSEHKQELRFDKQSDELYWHRALEVKKNAQQQ
jgi:hypothetical protein